VIALLQTLVAFGAITFWLYRAERFLREYLAGRRDPAPVLEKPAPIPGDLLVQAQQYAHDWARQQALDHMYELYGKFKDWSTVRGVLAAENEAGTI